MTFKGVVDWKRYFTDERIIMSQCHVLVFEGRVCFKYWRLPRNLHMSKSGYVSISSGSALLFNEHLKPGPHHQQCRSNIVECYNVDVASTLLPFLATMSKQRSTLLPKTATMSNEFCVEISSFCFDNVASTLLLVWTRLKIHRRPRPKRSYHFTVGFGSPLAAASNRTFCPSRTSLSLGVRVRVGSSTRSTDTVTTTADITPWGWRQLRWRHRVEKEEEP